VADPTTQRFEEALEEYDKMAGSIDSNARHKARRLLISETRALARSFDRRIGALEAALADRRPDR
jgi:hypothetical protein